MLALRAFSCSSAFGRAAQVPQAPPVDGVAGGGRNGQMEGAVGLFGAVGFWFSRSMSSTSASSSASARA
jgi:hypothetical protein